MLKLYTYFRSTAAYRVRIALNLKGIEHQLEPVHLVRNGGEQKQAAYLAKNPLGLVPTLEVCPKGETASQYITQSMAIIEYLEETCPTPALLPEEPLARARVRAITQSIACDIHPINNLRILQYLSGELNISEQQKTDWYQHWVHTGFSAIERMLSESPNTGLFCHGDTATLADCALVPQVYNAERFNCPMEAFPIIQSINRHCKTLDAFQRADPAQQPDAAA
ncbi:MAG: maleylacetoacetate isomerase [Gammaproteobacteria bacterium]|nr:maleylacetoacetate isomerase [Gammaproteobacteria bacterium]